MDILNVLEKATQINSVSGSENEIRKFISDNVKKYCDELSVDAMGNLIAHKKGSGKKKKSRFGGMSMNRFTVEETNLLSIYHEGSKAQLIENMTAALPYMDAGLRELAERTISKVNALTDAEYKELSVYPADEV